MKIVTHYQSMVTAIVLIVSSPVEASMMHPVASESVTIEPVHITATLAEVRVNGGLIPDFQPIQVANDGTIWLPIAPILSFAEVLVESHQQQLHLAPYAGEMITIDVEKRHLIKAGEIIQLAPNDVLLADGDILVSNTILSSHFNLRVKFRSTEGFVDVISGQPLPRDLRLMRQNSWRTNSSINDPKTELSTALNYAQPYGMFEGFQTDISINSSYQSEQSRQSTLLTAFSTSEALGLTHTLFAAADPDTLTTFRWTAGREHPDGDVFGIPSLYGAALGDIVGQSAPMVGSIGSGRGMKLQFAPIKLTENFSTTIIQGDAVPGWDAELYVAGQLRSFQRIGNDGRFFFPDVAISYGRNDIKVVLYSPNGTSETINFDQSVSAAMLRPGAIQAWATVIQPNSNTFGILQGNTPSAETDTINYSLRTDYGVSDYLTVSGNLTRQQQNSSFVAVTNHQFIGLEARTKVANNVLFLGSNTNLTKHRTAWYANLYLPQVSDGLSINYESFERGFDSAFSGYGSAAVKRRLGLSTSIPLSKKTGSIAVFAEQTDRHNDTVMQQIDAIYGHSFGSIPLTHFLSFYRQKGATDTARNDLLIYRSIMSYDKGLFQFRGEYNATISPYFESNSISAQLNYRKTDYNHYQLSYSYSFNSGSSTSISMYQEFENFLLSAGFSVDGEQTMFSTKVSFNFGYSREVGFTQSSRDSARLGAVELNIFEDLNYNALQDSSEQGVNGIDIEINGRALDSSRRADGRYRILNLEPNEPVYLRVGRNYLADNFQTSKENSNIRIIPRPGKIELIQVPIIDSAIISGIVTSADDNYFQKLSNVLVELYDESGNLYAETKPFSNGYYSFKDVYPGDWQLVYSTLSKDSKDRVIHEKKIIEIKKGQLDLKNLNIKIKF